MLYSGAGDSAFPPDKLPMIGNGFLAGQLMSDSLFCAGIFNGHGLEQGSHRARIPAPFAVPAPGSPGPAAMDMRQATYFRRSVVSASAAPCSSSSTGSCVNAAGGPNASVTVEQRWYAHRALPSVLVMEVQILSAHSAPPSGVEPYAMLSLRNSGGGSPSSVDFNFTVAPSPPGAPFGAVLGWTQGTECPPGDCGPVVTSLFGLAVLTTLLPPSGLLPVPVASAGSTFYFLSVVRSSLETAPGELLVAAAADYSAATALAAAGTLRSSHVAEWEATVWTSGFSSDRQDVALAVNSSLYAIVSSLRPDRPYSTSPGGLANNGYNGHSFWDQATWMFPTINLLYPSIAQSMLQYRVNRLPGARFKATTYSPPFQGAMFPWESAVAGIELASAPWGARELHISSDIAQAVWSFWAAMQDNSGGWLNATAWPIMEGVASFWMSKLQLDNPGAPPGSPLSLRDVMGPDEYHDAVDDNVFTNAGVIMALQHASAVAQLLGVEASVYAPWQDAAGRIVILFNESLGYHPEFKGYQQGTKVKQADTVILGFPFEFSHSTFSAATRAADLTAYAPVTDEGGVSGALRAQQSRVA